jgi:hypothetical protein
MSMMVEKIEVPHLQIHFLIPEVHVSLAPRRIGYQHSQQDNGHQQDTAIDMIMSRSLERETPFSFFQCFHSHI